MNCSKAIYRRAGGEGARHTVLGMVHEYKLLASESGKYTSFVAHIPSGSGMPLHFHEQDSESFYILEGEIAMIAADGAETIVGPGDYVWFAAGHEHAFRNGGEATARAVITRSPGVEAEMFLADMDAVARTNDHLSDRDVMKIGARHGIVVAKELESA